MKNLVHSLQKLGITSSTPFDLAMSNFSACPQHTLAVPVPSHILPHHLVVFASELVLRPILLSD